MKTEFVFEPSVEHHHHVTVSTNAVTGRSLLFLFLWTSQEGGADVSMFILSNMKGPLLIHSLNL